MAIKNVIQKNYMYTVEADFLYPGSTVSQKMEVDTLVIDSNYNSKSFSPVSYMSIRIPITLYDTMVSKIKSGKVYLSVYLNDVDSKIKRLYFKKGFSYNFPSINIDSVNKNIDDKDSKSGNAQTYKITHIGLIDMDALNNNRGIMNKLFKNTNMATIVHYFLNKSIIREPFDSNPDIDQFLIPPIDGIPSLLSYLNRRSSFYSTDFRYFEDYKGSYLLSNRGKGIDIGDGSYSTFHINVVSSDTSGNTPNVDGVQIDARQKLYTIQVTDSYVKFEPNTVQDCMYNQIYAVSYTGEMKRIDVDVNHRDECNLKPMIIRIPDNNFDHAKVLANSMEVNSSVINITQFSLDNTKLDPSKAYIFKFEDKYKEYNGNYLLVNKVESYSKSGDDYACNTVLKFKKVKS